MHKLTSHYPSTKPTNTITTRSASKAEAGSVSSATSRYSTNSNVTSKENTVHEGEVAKQGKVIPNTQQRNVLQPITNRVPSKQSLRPNPTLIPSTGVTSPSTAPCRAYPPASTYPMPASTSVIQPPGHATSRSSKENQPKPVSVLPSWARLKRPSAHVTHSLPKPFPQAKPHHANTKNAPVQMPKVEREVMAAPLVVKEAPLPSSSALSPRHQTLHRNNVSSGSSQSKLRTSMELQVVDHRTVAKMAIRTQKAQQASHLLKYVDDQADEEFEGHGHTLPTVTPNTAKFVPSPSLAQMTGNPTTVTTAHFSQGLPEKKRQWCSDFGSGKVERKSMSSPRTHHTSQDNTETRAKRVKSEETGVSYKIKLATPIELELMAQAGRSDGTTSSKTHSAYGLLQNGYQSTLAHNSCPSRLELAVNIQKMDAATLDESCVEDGEGSKQDEKEESAQELSDIEWDLEYAEDIFQYLLQRENELAPAASYTTKPREHWRARTICVDMIVHLVSKCGALDEAIFLAVNYMDRFFSTQPMFDLEVMVLVSGICVWLALKFDAKQALYPLHYLIVLVQQYMQRRYTRQDFLQGEQKVLKKLQYELGWPGPLTLLRWAARADGHTSKMQASSAFLLEICMFFPSLALQPPSLLVAAAMGIARYVAGWPYWDERLQDLLGYKERVVIPVSKCMIRFLHDPITTSTCSFQKYSTENLGFVMDELFAAFD